ncbi:MAG TPA: DoxX family membrane protein [Chloroflexia bacterium]|nr:DoxX family membrane protein [Chloroflexia bacterium]
MLARWLPIPLRVLVVVLVGPAVLLKFFAYDQVVGDFTGMGVPAPGLMVPVVGVIELVAVVAAILGLGRLAFVAVSVTMTVAVIVGGPTPVAVTALVAVLGLTVLGTGAFSLWQPETRYLVRLYGGIR